MWDGSKTQASNWDACTICNKTVARVVTLWLGRNIETQLCSTDSWTGWPSTDTHGHLMCAQVWSEFDDYQQRKILQGKRVTNLSILASLRINNPSINHHLAPLTMAECNGVRRSRSSQLGSAPANIIWVQIYFQRQDKKILENGIPPFSSLAPCYNFSRQLMKKLQASSFWWLLVENITGDSLRWPSSWELLSPTPLPGKNPLCNSQIWELQRGFLQSWECLGTDLIVDSPPSKPISYLPPSSL